MYQSNTWTRPLALHILLCLMIVAACTSCTGLSPRQRQQQQLVARLDSSLKRELAFIHQETDLVRYDLKNRLLDFFSSERAKIWQPIAETVQASAKTTYDQIDGMITMLDTAQTYRLFIKGPWSDSLYHLLARFRQTSLHVHERLLAEFEHTIIPHEGFNPTMPKDDVKKSLQKDFAHLTNAEAKALLHYWQKEIAITTNKLVTYCFNQVPNSFCGITFLTPLISQNQQTLAPGETLAITAGIGSYSIQANPSIQINGQAVPLTDNAVAYYKLKAGQQKGKYSIPIVIEYLDQSGIKMTSRINVDYTVE